MTTTVQRMPLTEEQSTVMAELLPLFQALSWKDLVRVLQAELPANTEVHPGWLTENMHYLQGVKDGLRYLVDGSPKSEGSGYGETVPRLHNLLIELEIDDVELDPEEFNPDYYVLRNFDGVTRRFDPSPEQRALIENAHFILGDSDNYEDEDEQFYGWGVEAALNYFWAGAPFGFAALCGATNGQFANVCEAAGL